MEVLKLKISGILELIIKKVEAKLRILVEKDIWADFIAK